MEEECSTTSFSEALVDVEEGEISDSASVEEISEEDFKKQEEQTTSHAKVKDSNIINKSANNNNINNNNNNTNTNNENNQSTSAGSRVWTMRDLYKYQVNTKYSPELYNLAWAQAVVNKPLDEALNMEYSKSDQSNSNGDDGRVVIDVDDDVKEDGELEEGEIDLDSEVDMDTGISESENGVKGGELEKRVDLIRVGLESVTVDDAEKSFEQVCSRLWKLLENLQEIVLEAAVSEKDRLIKLLIDAIQTVNNVFCSMNESRKEQNRDILSRFLDHLTNQKPLLFSPEQLKEIEIMISALDSSAVSMNIEESDWNRETNAVIGGVNKIDSDDVVSENTNPDLIYLKKCDIYDIPVESLDQNGPRLSFDYSRSSLPSLKQRGISLPLLDLHKDHDADSLPSPTREAPACLPIMDRAFGMIRGALKPEWPVPRGVLEVVEKGPVHPYETDAVKAVSSYQQKFGQTSFLMSDNLPSPTPSEDGDNGEGDIGGEVLSTSVNNNAHPISTSIMAQPPVSTNPSVDVPPGQGLDNAGKCFPVSSGPIPSVNPSVKFRDPRIRLDDFGASAGDLNSPSFHVVNNEPRAQPVLPMMNLRKKKPMEEPVLEGPALKRQRNEMTDFVSAKDLQALTGTGGWLEDRGPVELQVTNSNHLLGHDLGRLERAATSVGTSSSPTSVTVNINENLPMPSLGATSSVQSLLKDIAVNPSMWMNILKDQQKSALPVGSSTQPPISNSIIGTVPFSNIAAQMTSVFGQKSAGIPQTPAQTVTADETSKVRMKHRDPRRALHSGNSQKSGGNGNDQNKSKSSVRRQEGHPMSSHASTPPDIGRQFIKNLKNIGNIMSVSQAAIVPLVPPIQPVQAHQGRLDKGVVSEPGNNGRGTATPLEDVVVGPSRPQKTWKEVEHYFDGFDDMQKAAIHKERSRRIDEQKKMFANRKLSLVLDLDHTLLNSAKFCDVSPANLEILMKKEEVDREKTHRHLFRIPHMQMWTKLRPGIWNFLEKASKLFEMHLYTMGNKLYATEMAKLLDPKGELFPGRVIARGDGGDIVDGEERTHKNKDLEGVLGLESDVLVIDDSVRVWPHNYLNLIVVERYIYFPCSRRQFGLVGPSLLEIDHDERPEDGTLASSLAVIEKIHQLFFAHRSLEEVDVRTILAAEQRKILFGCRIVFSRVFPVGETNPNLHPLWKSAEQFGAICTTLLDKDVTHVVANSPGTDKVNWAFSTGKFVVHPSWVEASVLLYRRANEHDFAIKP